MDDVPVDPLLAPVIEAFAGDAEVTHDEKVFSSKPLKVRGKIFAMLVKERLVVKLPRDVIDRLVATGQGERFDPGHGRLMKEWVVLPARDQDRWIEFAQQARRFVGGETSG